MMKPQTFLLLTLSAATLTLQGCSVATRSAAEPYTVARPWHNGNSAQSGAWGHVGHRPATPHTPPDGHAAPPQPAPPSTATPEPPGYGPPQRPLRPVHPVHPDKSDPPGKADKPHKPGLGKPDKPSKPGLGKPSKPGLNKPGKGPKGTSAQACVAARKAAQAGLCEQALALLDQCGGNQHKATEDKVAEYCSLP